MPKSAILAYAFGVPSTIRSNQLIADIASKKATALGSATVYTQLDIVPWPTVKTVRVKEEPGKPPPTLTIARWGVKQAQEDRVTELWVVGSKPHIWRCLRDTEYAIKEIHAPIRVRYCDEVYSYSEDVWFCPDSTQQRTQSKENWEGREKILEKIPVWMYKLVTLIAG